MIGLHTHYGMDLPDPIANAPILFPGSELFFNAFRDLTTCRPGGMGLYKIPWTAIDQWCLRNGMAGESREELEYYVREMDSAWLDYHYNKQKAQSDIQAAKSKG